MSKPHLDDIMRNRLVIFDCYKTLIEAEEIGNMAYRRAVGELFGVEGGRTDADPTATTIQTVVIQIANKRGVSKHEIESKSDVILPSYENIFEDCVRTGEAIVLPGVQELLEALHRNEVPFGIYTGDSFRTVDALLKKAGLETYFPQDMRSCGSNETPDRTELLASAIQKAERKYGMNFSKSYIYVVDDSWRGIKAAEILGIKSVGVAGDPRRFERYGTNPTYFFADLSDYKRVLDIIILD